jgi:hypothetical protein
LKRSYWSRLNQPDAELFRKLYFEHFNFNFLLEVKPIYVYHNNQRISIHIFIGRTQMMAY